MDKRITELVSNLQLEAVEFRFEDELLTARIRKSVMDQLPKTPARKKRTAILLIAAILALLLAGCVAVVVYSQMAARDVSDEVVGLHLQDVTGKMGYFEWEDASLAFDFTIEGECREVYARLGWTPTPDLSLAADSEGWARYGRSDYADTDAGWEYQLYWGSQLRDTAWFIQGITEIVAEDTWNGLKRTKVTVHRENTGKEDVNYLLLFSETDSYLLRISGTYDFETLEHIAEELEIRVTDTVIAEPVVKDPTLFANQPLDMECFVGVKDYTGKEEGNLTLRFYGAADSTIVYDSDFLPPWPKVFFRTGWMPEGEPSTVDSWQQFWPEGEAYSGNCVIRMYWANSIRRNVFWFHPDDGTAEVVKEDTWNGMNRIEIAVTERYDGETYLPDVNHVFLHNPDVPFLVHIDGYETMDVLETVSEHLEFQITEATFGFDDFDSERAPEYVNVSTRGYYPAELLTDEEKIPQETQKTLEFSFDFLRAHQVTFEPGWLPAEPTVADWESCTPLILCEDPEHPGQALYAISQFDDYPGDNRTELKINFDGDCQQIRKTMSSDTVYGEMTAFVYHVTNRYDIAAMEADVYELAEGTLDPEDYRLPDQYKIVLWSQENGCLLILHGTADLQTLEKIAENLTIRPVDTDRE